ncbi:MAG: hypothetical protein KBG43_06175 [Paludibacteraceae bacterium]|nr:hypothetical protein [Paludibacteraceae bacterium]
MKTTKLLFSVTCLFLAFFAVSGFKPVHESGMNSTEKASLTVTTLKVLDIKSTRATCTFSITGSPVTEKGACCSQSPNPTINSKKSVAPGKQTNNGSAIMSGLKPETTYYVRAYAKSGNQVFYGNELTFTTPAAEEKTNSNSNFGQKKESKSGGSK